MGNLSYAADYTGDSIEIQTITRDHSDQKPHPIESNDGEMPSVVLISKEWDDPTYTVEPSVITLNNHWDDVLHPETKPSIISNTRGAYQPSEAAMKAFGVTVNTTNSVPVTNNSADLDSIITLDLLDFDAKFPCPICPAQTFISVVTLSDHMSRHKYENIIAEKMATRSKELVTRPRIEYFDDRCDSDEEIDIKKLIPGYHNVQKEAHVRTEHGNAAGCLGDIYGSYEHAMNESKREHEYLGGMTEEEAIAAAIAASELTEVSKIPDAANKSPVETIQNMPQDKPIHISGPMIIINNPRAEKQVLQLLRQEANGPDCNDIGCD